MTQPAPLRVGCVLMQRDENLLLDGWLRYYANLFGHQNLFIIDNGSTRPDVLRTLARWQRRGVFIERGFATPADFANKGETVSRLLRVLRDTQLFDFLFPLDCDEFLVLRTPTGFTADPALIHAHLRHFIGAPQTLKIEYEFLNTPGCPGYFRLIYCNKTAYAADSFSHTDVGFHIAGARTTKEFRKTRLAHAHFHNKPFARMRADALRKLASHGVDITDPAAIARITHSHHLLPVIQQNARAHARDRERYPHIFAPEFMALLHRIGAARGTLLRPCHPGQPRPPILLPDTFDPQHYLAANPDLAEHGIDPLLHYAMFGLLEGRRLSC